MDLSQLRQELKNRSGDENLIASQSDLWFNLGIKQWAKEDWPDTIAIDSSQTTSVSTNEYTLPTDYSKMLSVRVGASASSDETDATEFSFVRYENKNIATTGNLYYINPVSGKLGLIPDPITAGLPIFMKYQSIPADLTADSDEPPFPETYHEAILFFALKKYWETQDEFDKSIYYDTEWRNMMADMKTDLMKQSRGQLDRMKDIRELNVLNSPFSKNQIE